MPEVADIFGRYGPEYLHRFGQDLLPSHRRAMVDLQNCRTPALGGHVYTCNRCGHLEYSYHSCRNRSCPKCHAHDTEEWLAARRKELLPVPYFHVVFTLPQELRYLVRSHQKVLYGLLMKAAANALIKLAADPHYVGGLIGILAVLHTWTRTLVYHPHVHCLVPGGGVSQQNEWRPARKKYLVPVEALSPIFRGMFRDGLAEVLPQANVPSSVWRKDWVVYCKPTVQGADQVLPYLGRYVHRIAISNSRILSIEDGQVSFRYQEVDDPTWKIMTLDACEFIRRFLQHVLPAGVHKVRYFGLWHPGRRRLLHQVQLALALETSAPMPAPAQPKLATSSGEHSWEGRPCPCCRQGLLVWQRRLRRQPRAPP
jgi:hypothetical protein